MMNIYLFMSVKFVVDGISIFVFVSLFLMQIMTSNKGDNDIITDR